MDYLMKQTMLGMTWEEVEQSAKDGAVVFFPVGVVEAHGPHMPLGTDIYMAINQAENLKKELGKMEIPSVIAPPFYWGGIKALTRQFPGSFTARKETIAASMIEILESLDRAGFQKVILLNMHGDGYHKQALLEVIQKANHTLNLKSYWPVYEDDMEMEGFKGDEEYLFIMTPYKFEEMFEIQQMPADSFDVHAGAFETAVMMEILPDMVKTERIAGLKPTMLHDEQIEKWCNGEKEDKDLIAGGYCGDPASSLYIKSHMKLANYQMAKDVVEFLKRR